MSAVLVIWVGFLVGVLLVWRLAFSEGGVYVCAFVAFVVGVVNSVVGFL